MWPSGAPIGPPPPREPVPVRPTDEVFGRRVAWASPRGLLRDYWIWRGPWQGHRIGQGRPHAWFVGLVDDVAWGRWSSQGIRPDIVEWTPLDTVWLD